MLKLVSFMKRGEKTCQIILARVTSGMFWKTQVRQLQLQNLSLGRWGYLSSSLTVGGSRS
jgi:hypothetical protein